MPALVNDFIAQKLEELLKELGRREVVKELYRDVDYTKWGVDPADVKQPMALRTIEEGLARDRTLEYSKKRYKCVAQFAHDVRVVFKNGFLLTPARDTDKSGKRDLGPNKTFKATEEACKTFESSLAGLEEELDQRGPAVPLSGRCQLLLADLRRNPLSEWFRRDDWRDLGQEYVDTLASPPNRCHRCDRPRGESPPPGDRPRGESTHQSTPAFHVAVRSRPTSTTCGASSMRRSRPTRSARARVSSKRSRRT